MQLLFNKDTLMVAEVTKLVKKDNFISCSHVHSASNRLDLFTLKNVRKICEVEMPRSESARNAVKPPLKTLVLRMYINMYL